MRTPIHVHSIVCDAQEFCDYATVTLRVSSTRDSLSYFYVRSQRNALRYRGGIISSETHLRWEAERIERDAFAELWDVVPGFGAPYGADVDAALSALDSSCFSAFLRAIAGKHASNPSELIAALRADKRIALTSSWSAFLSGKEYTETFDVPSERKGGFAAFVRSPEVLRAKADELIEQAKNESARIERLALAAE